MTKAEYIAKYGNMTITDYRKLTKAELVKVMADFCNALKDGVQEYCTPWGDAWTVADEVSLWYHRQFKLGNDHVRYAYLNIEENDKSMMWRKKEWLVNYVIVLDLAFASMNEIMNKHRYHDCLSNLRKMMRV